jgi:hypothetical protein
MPPAAAARAPEETVRGHRRSSSRAQGNSGCRRRAFNKKADALGEKAKTAAAFYKQAYPLAAALVADLDALKASSDDKALYAKFKQLNHKQLKLLKVLRDSVGDRDRVAFKWAVKQGKKVSKKNDRVATKLGAPACAS